MDIPDGSLCRITESYKDCINNLMIVKNDQPKESEPLYKLVFLRDKDNGCESQSETSDEETSEEEEMCNIQLPAKTFVKEKNIDTKIDKCPKVNRIENKKTRKGKFNNKRYKNHNRNLSVRRNASGKIVKHYDKHLPITSNMEDKDYSYNSNKRNFNNSGSHNIAYNKSISNASIKNIEPWLNATPPSFMVSSPDFGYQMHAHYRNTIDPSRSLRVNSLLENSRTGAGLLGDKPADFPFCSNNQNNTFIHEQNAFHPAPPAFQPNNQKHPYVHEQNSFLPAPPDFQSNNQNGTFDHNLPPPVPSDFPLNNQMDNYRHGAQYWTSYDYPGYSQNDYQRRGSTTTSVPRPSHHIRKRRWQNPKSWNTNQKEHQRARRNLQDHFDYRN